MILGGFLKTFFTFNYYIWNILLIYKLRPWSSLFDLSIGSFLDMVHFKTFLHGSFHHDMVHYTKILFTGIIISLIVFSWFSYQQPLSFTFIEYAADIRSPTIIFTVWLVYRERWICSQCIIYYYYFCSSDWKVERLVWR